MPDLRRTRHRYIKELEGGPKTTKNMSLSLMVTTSAVASMMRKLRDAGVVRSSRVPGAVGNAWQHELIEQ